MCCWLVMNTSQQHTKPSFIQKKFWQSCIYRRWSHILLPSQTSWTSSAALFWWSSWPRVHIHLSLPCITTLITAVRLIIIMDGKGTSRQSLPECTERMKPPRTTQSWTRAGERVWDNLTAAPSAPNICVLLSMSTTTCKTFTQSKMLCISCCQHYILH